MWQAFEIGKDLRTKPDRQRKTRQQTGQSIQSGKGKGGEGDAFEELYGSHLVDRVCNYSKEEKKSGWLNCSAASKCAPTRSTLLHVLHFLGQICKKVTVYTLLVSPLKIHCHKSKWHFLRHSQCSCLFMPTYHGTFFFPGNTEINSMNLFPSKPFRWLLAS
jgi:hypothetical protein